MSFIENTTTIAWLIKNAIGIILFFKNQYFTSTNHFSNHKIISELDKIDFKSMLYSIFLNTTKKR